MKNKALDYWKHEEVIPKYEQGVELQLYDEGYETRKERRTKEGFVEAAQAAIDELSDHTRHIYKKSRNDGLLTGKFQRSLRFR